MDAGAMLSPVATVKWKLADYMQEHDVTAYELAVELGGHTRMSHAYRLANAKKPPTRIDFDTMGELIRGLEKITGKPVHFNDLLEYQPD